MCFTGASVYGQVVDRALSYVKKGNLLFANGALGGALANFNTAIEGRCLRDVVLVNDILPFRVLFLIPYVELTLSHVLRP
jgi:hypothetical protein